MIQRLRTKFTRLQQHPVCDLGTQNKTFKSFSTWRNLFKHLVNMHLNITPSKTLLVHISLGIKIDSVQLSEGWLSSTQQRIIKVILGNNSWVGTLVEIWTAAYTEAGTCWMDLKESSKNQSTIYLLIITSCYDAGYFSFLPWCEGRIKTGDL